MSEELKPCPFCGGVADPTGWMCGDGRQGPECESCGATGPSAEGWNLRAEQCDAAVAAIAYVIDNPREDPMQFLRCWNEGNFESLRKEWPNVPDAVFIGAELARLKAGQGDQDGCNCQGCGGRYTADLLVPDDTWEKIKPEGKAHGAGLLCPNCIMSRLAGIGWSAGHLSPRAEAGRGEAVAWECTAVRGGVSMQRSTWKSEEDADGWIEHYKARDCQTTKTPLYIAPPASADAVSVPPEWRDMLEELQWQHRDHDDYYHNPAGFYCPSCFASQEAGHASQCRIRALLAQSESEGVKS